MMSSAAAGVLVFLRTLLRNAIIAVMRNIVVSDEGLPRDGVRVANPGLARTCITALGIGLLDRLCASSSQTFLDLFKLTHRIRLKTDVTDTVRTRRLADREIDAWIVEHPFCVVILDYGWVFAEKRFVELD